MSNLFSEFVLNSPRGPLKLVNRVVVAPMCQYSAHLGKASDWHLFHWAGLLNSGAAMLIIEATAVTPHARISPQCLGLWDDETAGALSEKLGRARKLAPKIPVCIQLSHAGRKGSSSAPWRGGGQLIDISQGGWQTEAPSPIPHLNKDLTPRSISSIEMTGIKKTFVDAAMRAEALSIEAVELHAAHGYLLHQFLSPLSNTRTDEFGGNFDGRTRFPLEVFKSVREKYNGVLGMRISASDWVEGGWTPEETADFALRLKLAGANYVHISSGGISALQKIPPKPSYQVPFAKLVKEKTGLPTIAVGLITEPNQAQEILTHGDADLVAMARSFIYRPRWMWEAAAQLEGTVMAVPQHSRCAPREVQNIFVIAQVDE